MSLATTPRRRRPFSLFCPIARRIARVASLPSPQPTGRGAFKPRDGSSRWWPAVSPTSRFGVGQVLVGLISLGRAHGVAGCPQRGRQHHPQPHPPPHQRSGPRRPTPGAHRCQRLGRVVDVIVARMLEVRPSGSGNPRTPRRRPSSPTGHSPAVNLVNVVNLQAAGAERNAQLSRHHQGQLVHVVHEVHGFVPGSPLLVSVTQ